MRRLPLIERYRDMLPVTGATPVVSLGEGTTPLVPLTRLSERLGLEVHAKLEGMNPTGSFKDRGMTVAMTKAVEEGATAVICASTGNTSASAAAYAARAGLRAAVVIPGGKIAAGKLAQALVHGAIVLAMEGNFDEALHVVRELVERRPIALVNNLNPYRLEGQKTGAWEICDDLGDAPDVLCIPVGNAGNITAYSLGFAAYRDAGRSTRLPRLLGFLAAGSAPLVIGHKVEHPETVATAIRIGNPARWRQAVEALDESDGLITAVSDDDILAAWHLLAKREGVWVEPASATGLAALRQQIDAGALDPAGQTAVIVLTGHGLKDPGTAVEQASAPVTLPATLAALEAYLTKQYG